MEFYNPSELVNGTNVSFTQDAAADMSGVTQLKLGLIQAARAAWDRLKNHQTWQDWRTLGVTIAAGRGEAMQDAKTNRPKGRRYCEAFNQWLVANGFSDIGKSTRARLLQCMDNMDAIEAWLAALDAEKRFRLNHPAAVLIAWKRETGTSFRAKEKVPDLLVAWNKATDRERTTALNKIDLADFFRVMPASWRAELMKRVTNLGGQKIGEPDARITKILHTALSHVEIADAPNTSEIVAKSNGSSGD